MVVREGRGSCGLGCLPGSFWGYAPALAMRENREVAQRWQAGISSANEEPGKGEKNSLLEKEVSGLAWLLESEARHWGGEDLASGRAC